MSKMDIYSQYISRQQHLSENSLISGQKLISEREVLINRLMAEGFTSKQIENLLTNYFQLNEKGPWLPGPRQWHRAEKIIRDKVDDALGTEAIFTIDDDVKRALSISNYRDAYKSLKRSGPQPEATGRKRSITAPAPGQQTTGSTDNGASAARPTAGTTSAVGSRAIYGPVADMIPDRAPPNVSGPGGEMARGETQFTKKEIEQTRKEADAARQTKTQSDPDTKTSARPARPTAKSAQPGSKTGSRKSSLGSELGKIGYKVRATPDTAGGQAKIKLLDQAAEDRAKARAKTTGRPAWAQKIPGFENY